MCNYTQSARGQSVGLWLVLGPEKTVKVIRIELDKRKRVMVCVPHLQSLHRVSATTPHFHLFCFIKIVPFITELQI